MVLEDLVDGATWIFKKYTLFLDPEKQKSRKAEKQKSRKAEKQKSKNTEKQKFLLVLCCRGVSN